MSYTFATLGLADGRLLIGTNMPEKERNDLNRFLERCGGYSPERQKMGSTVVIPAVRLCPYCFIEISLDPSFGDGGGCKRAICPKPTCKKTFCFGCLATSPEDLSKCSNIFGECATPVKPFQKLVPYSEKHRVQVPVSVTPPVIIPPRPVVTPVVTVNQPAQPKNEGYCIIS